MKLEIIENVVDNLSSAPLVLFIHGSYHGAWCWEENFLPYFAKKGISGKAISLRGHGSSGGYEKLRWTRISDYVEDVIQTVNDISEPPILIGHSMGGFIVQKYLERASAPKIKGAILLSSVPHYGLWKMLLRTLLKQPFLFLWCLIILSTFPLIGTPKRAREHFFSENLPKELQQKYFSNLQPESSMSTFDMLMLNLPRPKKPSVPLLITGSENDKMVYSSEVEATAKTYGVQCKLFQKIAHDMMLDSGWQRVADYLISWIGQTMPPNYQE